MALFAFFGGSDFWGNGLANAFPAGRRVDPWYVRQKTALVDAFSIMADRRTRLGTLRKTVFTSSARKMAPGHSHPVAAAQRSDASRFITSIAESLGKTRYDTSISARERGGLATGPRQLRAAKDLLSDSQQAILGDDQFVSFIDTDYYLTEKELSTYAGHDIGMYGLQPDGLCGTTSESHWSFISKDTIVEEVKGGARYEHQIWDWSSDLVVMGRGWRTYVYDPITYQVGKARAVTVLLVARTIFLPLWFVEWLYPDLKKYRPRRMVVDEQGGFLVGSFGPPEDRVVSIKAANALGEDCVSIKPGTFRTLGIAAQIPNTDKKVVGYELLPSAVERICKSMGEKVGTYGAYILSRLFTGTYTAKQLVNYQSVKGLVLEDGKPQVVMAGVPLAGHGVGPTASYNNEARAVEERVVGVRNDTKFPPEMVGYSDEFAELVVKYPGKGTPLSMEELRLEQTKPMQRMRRLEEQRFVPDEGKSLHTSSFQKKETYAKVGDPRLINQVPTDHTNRLGCYAIPFKKVVLGGANNRKWFAVGKTPLSIAQGLRGLQKSVGGPLAGGDYSRMDGRTSVDYRINILEKCMHRHYGPQYRKELDELLSKERNAKTTTKGHKVKANMGGANLSGSGVTTILNTLNAAFNEYAARRVMGETPTQAFKKLGIYFGDDSALDSAVFDRTSQVAEKCGMKMTREEIPDDAGPGYVVFLSRVYPDIRTSLASHPCTVRALRKMCTVTAPTTAGEKVLRSKLQLKAKGVLATDSKVPLISNYAKALERVYPVTNTGRVWEHLIAEDKAYQHKVQVGAYPYEDGDEDLLAASVARELGIGVPELQLLMHRLDTAKTEQDLAAITLDGGAPELPDWATWVPTTVAT